MRESSIELARAKGCFSTWGSEWLAPKNRNMADKKTTFMYNGKNSIA